MLTTDLVVIADLPETYGSGWRRGQGPLMHPGSECSGRFGTFQGSCPDTFGFQLCQECQETGRWNAGL